MEGQNEGLRFSSLGFALAAAIMLAACGSDSSSGVVNGGGSSDVSYGKMTDRRDGQVYKTVKIGTQTWMAENLNYKVDSSWCYNNSSDSCAKYGRLYQWAAAMDIDASYNDEEWDGSDVNHRGVCPAGWHVPTKAEWETLETTVGGKDVAGTALMSRSGWNECGNGTDDYGFSALPAGYRGNDGSFLHVVSSAYFWGTAEDDNNTGYAYIQYVDCNNPAAISNYAFMYAGYHYKDYAYSVRCLKD